MFSTILVANRGEIACRVIRTAKSLGYRTVAVFSEADADALHVRMADLAVPIGPAPVGQSYLSIARLIEAARVSGADAVHPGYGFLSENAGFARACAEAGVTFIGPPPEAIELMGSKRLSKLAMIEAGVPCIPGYQGGDQGDARLMAEAERIGFPLMVKASAGGGGRGMRLVQGAGALTDALQAARSEAQSAFGSGELILERAVIEPRHVEIQVFADGHGNVVHLGERDCSIQRRHQKVVEEAPSPFVSPDLRAAMGQAAVEAARACGYRGAGTVEFLVDGDSAFYFLEMNTRLQVEHPVTEAITGQDLVAWQIAVAAGTPLPLTQEEITLRGWAMEVRLYAEDPRAGFMPQTGPVLVWDYPEGPGLRVDHGLRAGQVVSPHYDPMLAKIVAHGATREEARRQLVRAVEETVLLGVKSNKAFLAKILRHEIFAGGGATTGFLDAHFAGDETVVPGGPDRRSLGLAAILMHQRSGAAVAPGPDYIGWRNSVAQGIVFRLDCDGASHDVRLQVVAPGRFVVTVEGEEERIELIEMGEGTCRYLAGGMRRELRYVFAGGQLFLDGPMGNVAFRDVTHAVAAEDAVAGSGRIVAPMDGAIVAVHAAVGDRVAQGQVLIVLEAMKMEHQLRADMDGVVTEIGITAGQQVKIRQVLAMVAAEAPDAG